jgi:NADPH:quinone reductase-like Zn-dependent oxidoreductase
MKAIVYHNYGSPDVLRCDEIDKPTAGDNEVLIKVRAASVNPLDVAGMTGRPYIARIVYGLRSPKDTRPGVDVAGQVEAVGRSVKQFIPGDEVFGVCVSHPQASGVKVWVHHQGSLAEYVCAHESTLVRKPENMTFEEAASAPVAAFTALQGLRDKGQIRPGQRVLINGAAGGVGTFAVQVAKSFGAEVTGVCGPKNLEMVRSIGADHVIDYTLEDFTKHGQHYDVIFDCVSNHSLSACRHALTSSGIYIGVGDMSGRSVIGILARVMKALVLSWFVSQRLVTCLARPNSDDLTIMHDLMKAGRVKPVVDRVYSLSQVHEAIRYLEGKHARGKVVITLENSRGT